MYREDFAVAGRRMMTFPLRRAAAPALRVSTVPVGNVKKWMRRYFPRPGNAATSRRLLDAGLGGYSPVGFFT